MISGVFSAHEGTEIFIGELFLLWLIDLVYGESIYLRLKFYEEFRSILRVVKI